MTMVKDIKINDFDYSLPDSLIAKHPLLQRDNCRLLLHTPQNHIYHKTFRDIPALIPPGSMLVCNDTKVIRARLLFHKHTGAAIEIFLLEPSEPSDYALNFQSTGACVWKCLVGNLKKWKEEDISLRLNSEEGKNLTDLYATKLHDNPDGSISIRFHWENSGFNFSQIIERAGAIPIPPYLNRESEESDYTDYQTVYANMEGSVAAPTAGLHFTPEVFEGLKAHAVPVKKITLHVGAGTFRPVKSEIIGDHDMHSERFTVTAEMVESLLDWKRHDKPVVATGTTTARTLESIPYIARALKEGHDNPFRLNQWTAYASENDFHTIEVLEYLDAYLKNKGRNSFTASTAIMIAPGFKWRMTDALITNFHQPKSTLLLLVSSFLGKNGNYNQWHDLYEEALREKYRFLSYGDACLLIR